MSQPHVSVVVPTRERASHVAASVAAILLCRGAFEVIVVDQSDGTETADALAPFSSDARLHHVRTSSRGVSAARNIGIGLSRGQLVAFTDDDCRVPPDWVDSFERVFDSDVQVAVVCGRVHLPPGAERIGVGAHFEPRDRRLRRFPPPGQNWGLTANMIVRRSTFERVGVFDELLGVGSPLGSGAETDLLVRVWNAQLTVINASEVDVLHLGIRAHGADARKLILRYALGIGAAFFKHARLRSPGRWLYVRWLVHLIGRSVKSLVTGRRPTGLAFIAAFLRGALLSLRYGVDRKTSLYAARPIAREPNLDASGSGKGGAL